MRKFSKIAAASVSLMALVQAGQAFAQDVAPAADEGVEEEQILVVGTLIRGVQATGSQTISVTPEEIAAKAPTSTNELLGAIPQIANQFNGRIEGDPRGIQGSSTSITRPNLRNFPSTGSTSGALTLMLVDGLRLSPVGVNQASVDADIIPAAVIAGVDVMTDGGSSLYGADAVAGVLNFRTLRTFEGIKIDGNYGFGTTIKAYDFWDASITAGHSWNGGNAYVSVSHTDRGEVLNGDTTWSNGIVFNAAGVPRVTFTQCRAPQQTVTRWGRFGAGATNFTSNAGFPGAGTASLGTGCDRVVEDSYSPRLTRTSVFGAISQEFGDNIDLRVTAYWTKRDIELHSYPRGMTSAGSGITTAAALTTAFPDALLTPVGGFYTVPEGVGFSFGTNAAYVNTPLRTGFETWGVTPELTFKLPGDWQVRASAHYGQSDNFQAFPGTNTVLGQCYITGCTAAASPTGAAIAAGQLNPLNAAAAAAGVITAITNYEDAQQTNQRMFVFRTVADGPLFALPGGDAKVAIGVEYQDNFAESRLASGAIGLVETLAYRSAQRNSKSVFGELSLPITSFATLSGSVRYDSYSDAAGDTTNPSIGLVIKPAAWVKLFGHWNTSFNAPTAIDTLAIGTGRFACGIYTPGSTNPAQRPTDQSVLTNGALPLRDTSRQGSCALVLQGSSPGLQPQTAESWAVGFEVTPGNWRIGGEFYHIDLANALGTLNPSVTSTYLTNPTLYTYNINAADYAAVLATLGNGTALGAQQPSSNIAIVVDTRISNLNAAIVEGVDFHIFYNTTASFGDLSFGLAGTMQTKAAITNGGVLTDDLGKGTPELFVTSFIGWKDGPLSARLTINYSGTYHDNSINSGGQVDVVSPFTVLNLNLGYTFGESAGMLEGTSLRLTIDNMFDEKPQTIRRVNTNNPSFNNWTLGRVIKLGATVKF